ncbi:23S rRNA (adenine(2030)-N(6))-methyltransferase RlmJ [Spongiibacter sp. KMU-166]|uniref:Ribosomal RNA large subunit methyltransferase J n=1 Tax=Spongiibacter thalassae TaxID=2721624 RepID=A0ABX1GFT1_9GAMM|nr:23S rRNA (adenine(2030)-N(6))-methyltransferase RlmJ [Spongiibacter thalassae]NKI18070.1 23S rRNA (adenine(2030)-N(6))-methyltransferase RlmJ [Spongiibacter thalassae]
MLSYRHGFHAGNHADVLKHLVQVLLLDYLQQKDKALLYVDTHAGAGSYLLNQGFAAKNREHDSGIGRLRAASWRVLPAPLQRYLAVVEACTEQDAEPSYPGSPAIALEMLRRQDHAELFELHPADCDILQRRAYRHASVHLKNGFDGLRALLPPASRRALVLIDPPYENKADYKTLCRCLEDSLKRFAQGVYAVWYPLLPQGESLKLQEKLTRLSPENYLHASLEVSAASGERGMYGSAMFVINPPWLLRGQLEEALPVLAELLGIDGQGSFSLSGQQR